ncbi:TonB family protein [Hartmannibacter diazotrophicus]|nr:TonB family protein [Hartmannibacter diazotrophicus]
MPAWPSFSSVEQGESKEKGAPWGLAFMAVIALHAGVGAMLFDRTPPQDASPAPEAVVMIDLPPDLALPPAESVESIASMAVAAERPQDVPAEMSSDVPPDMAAVTDSPFEPPPAVESIDAPDMPPLEDTPPLDMPPEETAQPVEEVAIAEATPVDPVEAVVSDVALAPALPTARPKPPAPQQRTKTASTKPAKVQKRAAPASPSPAAIESRKASGSGQSDPNALKSYVAKVRARIMRQRRSVDRDAATSRPTVVSFTVAASGQLSAVQISHSSGNADLDAAAVAMVRRAGSMPAFPDDLGQNALQLKLPVRFDR